LIVETEGMGEQPAASGADHQAADAAEEDRARHSGDVLVADPLTDYRKDFFVAILGGGQIIGLVEIGRVDRVAGDKVLDGKRLVALGYRLGEILRLEDDVAIAGDLIAFHLRIALNRLAGL